METPFFIPAAGSPDALYGVRYDPAGTPRCSVVMCHPLFEERKGAQRIMVEAARALAARGCRVLRFDYRGCGDSTGDFRAFRLADWQADVAAVVAHARQLAPRVPVGTLGVRLGAWLALAAPEAAFAVLWEPVANGRRHLDQELRRKLIKEMVTFGQSRATRTALQDELAAGRGIDLDGYALTPGLSGDLWALDAAAWAGRPPARVFIAGVAGGGSLSRDVQDLGSALKAAGADVATEGVAGDPFWSLVGVVECPELVARTAAWVDANVSAGPREDGPVSLASQADAAPVLREGPVDFVCEGNTLHGVWHAGEQASLLPVVVMLHGWAGSRIGPHRMFVPMARRLASRGCPVLRFDFRGRGDSEGAVSAASIRSMVSDTRAAIDCAMARAPGRPIVLLGICSGGKVAIATAAGDPRVSGLALWSAEPMGPMRQKDGTRRKSASALRLYTAKLLRPETWRKLLTFRVNVGMVRKAVTSAETAGSTELADEAQWLRRWRSFRGPVLFIYGTNDPDTPVARAGYLGVCGEAGLMHEWHDIHGANHSFYSLAWEREVLDLTEDWVRRVSLTT